MLVVSRSIFHKRRRKMMALIPLKRHGRVLLPLASWPAVLTFSVATASVRLIRPAVKCGRTP